MRRHPFTGGAKISLPAILIVVFTYTAATSAAFISGDALDSSILGPARGRTLLQAKKSCPISFEFKNYSIITGQCKGPQYPPKLCCAAFVEFACPYADQLNDPSNDCATTMFSYINLYGSYPPGLFASECKDSKRGLECAGVPVADVNQESTATTSAASATPSLASLSCLMSMILFLFVPLWVE